MVVLKNKLNTAYQKHLTLFNREDIEKLLKAGFKFYEIADKIQKHKTTISKEVKKYRTEHKPSNYNNKTNYCKHKSLCDINTLSTRDKRIFIFLLSFTSKVYIFNFSTLSITITSIAHVRRF